MRSMKHRWLIIIPLSLCITMGAVGCAGARDTPPKHRALRAHADAESKSQSALKRRLTRKLDRWRRSVRAPGAQIAVTDGSRVIAVSAGVSNRSSKRRMRNSMRLRIASASKTLVAAVALQLVGAGKLSLSSRIDRWFPDLPESDRITLRMLLRHTSGVPDYLQSDEFDALPTGADHPWGHDAAVAAAAGMTRPFAPGARYEYSNTNYHLIGLIIEDVTGMSLLTNIRSRFLARTKLSGVRLDDGHGRHPANAHGYDVDGNDLTTTEYAPSSAWRTAGWADGAGIMKASELARWGYRLLATNEVLSPRMLDAMISPAEESDDGNGLGIFGEDVPGSDEGSLSHSGGDAGFESLVVYYPDLDVSVGVIINAETADNAAPPEDIARSAALLVANS